MTEALRSDQSGRRGEGRGHGRGRGGEGKVAGVGEERGRGGVMGLWSVLWCPMGGGGGAGG